MASRRPARKRPQDSPKRRRVPADNTGGALLGETGLDELHQLIRLVKRTGIGELELSSGGRTVRISATAKVATTVPSELPEARADAGRQRPGSAPGPPPGGGASAEKKSIAITSPMVGTFYRAPAPDADPYVEMGDMVEVGQTVCIVEAMKLMNEIESEVRGRIVQILVENAHPVEFGQTLFLLEPA